jgi:hypothetical protein
VSDPFATGQATVYAGLIGNELTLIANVGEFQNGSPADFQFTPNGAGLVMRAWITGEDVPSINYVSMDTLERLPIVQEEGLGSSFAISPDSTLVAYLSNVDPNVPDGIGTLVARDLSPDGLTYTVAQNVGGLAWFGQFGLGYLVSTGLETGSLLRVQNPRAPEPILLSADVFVDDIGVSADLTRLVFLKDTNNDGGAEVWSVHIRGDELTTIASAEPDQRISSHISPDGSQVVWGISAPEDDSVITRLHLATLYPQSSPWSRPVADDVIRLQFDGTGRLLVISDVPPNSGGDVAGNLRRFDGQSPARVLQPSVEPYQLILSNDHVLFEYRPQGDEPSGLHGLAL